MYCSKCGAEFGPRESSCFNCGEPRPDREKMYEENTFMSENGLRDNYIPLLWELLILYLLVELIAYLIVPSSSYYLTLNNIFNSIGTVTLPLGSNVNSLSGFFQTMFSQTPRIWKISAFISMLASLLYYALILIAAWRIFKKADMPGWKCLIPIYNIYCVFKIVMGNGWYFLLIPTYYVVYIFFILGTTTMAYSLIVTVISILMGIVALIFFIWFAHKAAVIYHHGWGYTIGLLCFTNLFIMFLGFGGGIVDEAEEPGSQMNDFYEENPKTPPPESYDTGQKLTTSVQEQPGPETPEKEKCPSCGEPIDPDWEFCRHCGAQLSSVQEQPVPNTAQKGKCPSCGEPIDPDWKFCRNCGARLSK